MSRNATPADARGLHVPPEPLPGRLRFTIEVPRGGFVKRSPEGKVEFVSPLPCPFNYGSVPGSRGADGDPADVIVLGPRLARGSEGELPVWGRVRLRDEGVDDPKWICASEPPDEETLRLVDRFFSVYALGKLAWQRMQGQSGETRYAGLDRLQDGRLIGAIGGGTAKARFRRKPWR